MDHQLRTSSSVMATAAADAMFKQVMPSDSKSARKRSAYPFAKDARAVQV
jgi:hypothetical protein